MSVYFARSGAYVKIGYSADPVKRMTTVTRKNTERPADLPCGSDVTLLGWIPGGYRRESAVHRMFALDHVEGEWFYLDDETVRGLIWSDPHGIDVERMTAVAVFAAIANPELSREQIAGLGIRVEAPSLDEFVATADLLLEGGAA